MKLNKKAQVYVFAAIVLVSVVIASISAVKNFTSYQDAEVIENFKTELYYVINNALFNNLSVVHQIDNFTKSFKAYALTKNYDIDIFLLYYNSTLLYVVNGFDDNVTLKIPGKTLYLMQGSYDLGNVNNITVVIGNDVYKFNLGFNEYKGIIKYVKGNNVFVHKI